MSNKLALILLGVWTLIVIAGCGGAFWYVGTQVPWHEWDKRASAMGAGVGTVTCIGYAAILLPWAIAWRRRREEEERQRNERDDDRPRPRKRKR